MASVMNVSARQWACASSSAEEREPRRSLHLPKSTSPLFYKGETIIAYRKIVKLQITMRTLSAWSAYPSHSSRTVSDSGSIFISPFLLLGLHLGVDSLQCVCRIVNLIVVDTSLGDLAQAIAGGDVKRISSIKGVGRKTAGKICVELKDKVGQFAFAAGGASGGAAPMANDAVMALRALGFAEDASAKMVADVLAANPSVDSVGQVVKLALAGR